MKRTVFVVVAVLLSAASAQMTWTCATSAAPWGPRTCHTSVAFDGKMWVIGGCTSYPDSFKNDVWYSADGVSWICATTSAPWSPRGLHTSVVFHDSMWVIGGGDDGLFIGYCDVWRSADGANWTRATDSAPWGRRAAHSSVVHDNKMWVIGGYPYGGVLSDVWYSTDGVSWTCATDSAPWDARSNHASVVFDNKMWVMAGSTPGVTAYRDVWYTTDGVNWTPATDSAMDTTRTGLEAVVFDGKMCVTGGYVDGFSWLPLNDVWYSTDGATWNCADSSADWRPRGFHASLVYNNLVWVLGGDSTESGLTIGDVWYSDRLGVEESHKPQATSYTLGPTILSGASGVKRLASCIIFDAMGRRAANPKPGVYFVREAQAQAQAIRKVVVTK